METARYGERLQAAMDARGAKRKDLAAAIGVSAQAVGDVIRGKSLAFTAENNAKTARFLRINPDWLATGEGPVEIGHAPVALTLPMPTVYATGGPGTEATLGQTLERLGQLLDRADEKTRTDVAALLSRYAQNPAEGKRLAQAIEILLGVNDLDS